MSANSDNLKPQPPPVRGAAKPTWPEVVKDCASLSETGMRFGKQTHADVWALLAEDGKACDAFGAEKYGTRHQHDNGRDHARDAYQEALDGMMYAYAECERVHFTPAALELYEESRALAFRWRRYLLERDGR